MGKAFRFKITVLCDNVVTVPVGVVGEHGFACHIESPDGRYLFDTGQGQGLVGNAAVLGTPLSSLDAVCLSHGHFDHTGGLPAVLQHNGPTPIYAHPDLFSPHFVRTDTHTRFVGLPFRRSFLEANGATFHLGREMREIAPGIFLTGQIPRKAGSLMEAEKEMMVPDSNGAYQPDPLHDDLSLILDSAKGLIIVCGCAHAGIDNILEYVANQTGGRRIHALIGGTHLGFLRERQWEKALTIIERYEIERIGVSHCTGPLAAAWLYQRLPGRFFFAGVGTRLTI